LQVVGDSFGAVCRVKSPQDLSEVGFNGRLRDDQSLRDCPVPQAFRDERKDLLLAGCERVRVCGIVASVVAANAIARFGGVATQFVGATGERVLGFGELCDVLRGTNDLDRPSRRVDEDLAAALQNSDALVGAQDPNLRAEPTPIRQRALDRMVESAAVIGVDSVE
jgi:hypothetical protein